MNTAELKNTKEELLVWIESLADESTLNFLQTPKLSSEPEQRTGGTH